MSEAIKVKKEGPHAFARFIQIIARGQAHDEASQALQELAQALHTEALNTRDIASGELTLKVRFTAGGNLTPKNPAQMELELRDVSAPPAARDAEFEEAPKPAREV